MRPATITRAQAALPATRAELAAALGVGQMQAGYIAKYMIDNRYAEEWGAKLTDKGTLAPVLHSTGRQPEIGTAAATRPDELVS